ncbi:MAG: cyclodeaminase/cyclohydrolase family protein [Caldilineales bacterium]|nr:cyclodeaminase/cyclohydrolase family protein [Caldilineales bacterium]
MQLTNLSILDFLDKLAEASPAPGGGACAGLSGAQGAALAAMVCRLTIGRAKYAAVEAEMMQALYRAENLQAKLTALIDADATAFEQVAAAYKLSKDTDDQRSARIQAIQEGLKVATQTPLQALSACVEVLELCPVVIAKGNVNAASDGAAGACAANAGMMIAAANVRINVNAIDDSAFVEEALAQMGELVKRGRAAFDLAWAEASERLGPMP